jgi:hypothetical protein
MKRCDACPPNIDGPGSWVATFEKPKPRTFSVCAVHAAQSLRNGAVITPAPIEGE